MHPVQANDSAVPSGLAPELYEVLIDKVGAEDWLRFRFLAPEIARSRQRYTFADVEADMAHLCNEVALPYMADRALVADKVAIGFTDRPVPFGVADPNATQFIEVFRIQDETCQWEAF